MHQSSLMWPNLANDLQESAESVIEQLGANMDGAVARLNAITEDASYARHPLSSIAEAQLGLRADLERLLTQGQVLTASPYQYQVGTQQDSGKYMNPQTAMTILAAKLNDHVDKNRPAGPLYCIAIMISESQLSHFSAKLNSISTILPLPEWCQVARQATALSTNSIDKLYQPAAIAQPRFKPQSNLNADPLREYLKLQGSQLATLESLANDKDDVINKLSELAVKRTATLSQINTSINTLKNVTESVWSMSLTGSAHSIATQLNQASIHNNNQYTVASLLLSSQPLTFFEELLCSV